MKLTDLYELTSGTISLTDNDLILISDYNNNAVNSKACSLKELKNFFTQNYITNEQLQNEISKLDYTDAISAVVDKRFNNMINDIIEKGGNLKDYIIFDYAGFSTKHYSEIIYDIIALENHNIYNNTLTNILSDLQKLPNLVE